jgi:hypothetical protein
MDVDTVTGAICWDVSAFLHLPVCSASSLILHSISCRSIRAGAVTIVAM